MNIQGIIPALVTPFDSSGNIHIKVLEELVEHVVSQGCHGVFCLGSNGEFHVLTAEEKLLVAKTVVETVNGRVPVYAGTGCVSTSETIQLSQQMKELGVDALSVITPYFVPLTQRELIEHYRQINQQVNLPIILYNIPKVTGNNLQIETVKELATLENIVAIKDSSGNFDHVLQLIDLVDDHFSVLVGTDSLILPGLMAGAQGAIAATANLYPQTVVQIYDYWQRGEYKLAATEQAKLQPIRSAFKLGTLPSVLKQALIEAGMNVGQPRYPILPVEESVRKKIQAIVTLEKRT